MLDTCVLFRAIGSIFLNVKRLGVDTRSCLEMFFNIVKKNSRFEVVLEILGDALCHTRFSIANPRKFFTNST